MEGRRTPGRPDWAERSQGTLHCVLYPAVSALSSVPIRRPRAPTRPANSTPPPPIFYFCIHFLHTCFFCASTYVYNSVNGNTLHTLSQSCMPQALAHVSVSVSNSQLGCAPRKAAASSDAARRLTSRDESMAVRLAKRRTTVRSSSSGFGPHTASEPPPASAKPSSLSAPSRTAASAASESATARSSSRWASGASSAEPAW